MKTKIIFSILASLAISHAYAADDDKFFVAYSAAQSSRTSDVLKKDMLSPTNLDKIVVTTLRKIGQEKLVSVYFNRPDMQTKLQNVVINYLNSDAANQIFDDASTRLFSSTYSIEELQAIYQLNTSKYGKEFIDNGLKIDTVTQTYVNNAFKEKFDKQSLDKLDADVENVFKKLNIEPVPIHNENESDPNALSVKITTKEATNPAVDAEAKKVIKPEAATPVVEKPAIVEPAKETVKPVVEAEPSATSVKVTTRTVAPAVVDADKEEVKPTPATPVVEKPAIVEPAKETVKPAVEAEPSATSVKVTTRTVAPAVVDADKEEVKPTPATPVVEKPVIVEPAKETVKP
ncbi:hypothetical protein, partial [Acinetobacter gerneri]